MEHCCPPPSVPIHCPLDGWCYAKMVGKQSRAMSAVMISIVGAGRDVELDVPDTSRLSPYLKRPVKMMFNDCKLDRSLVQRAGAEIPNDGMSRAVLRRQHFTSGLPTSLHDLRSLAGDSLHRVSQTMPRWTLHLRHRPQNTAL